MINENMPYSAEFFGNRASISERSAGIVIPLLFNFYRPESVVDLGCATGFIADLTSLSDVVLFSAAIPLQVGTHHVNCQWQRYWAELFARRGFVKYDCFRPILWNDGRVNVIYRNNMFLYVKESSENPEVCGIHQKIPCISMPAPDMIHKDLYLSIANGLIFMINEETEKNDELLKNFQQLKGQLLDLQERILNGK